MDLLAESLMPTNVSSRLTVNARLIVERNPLASQPDCHSSKIYIIRPDRDSTKSDSMDISGDSYGRCCDFFVSRLCAKLTSCQLRCHFT